MSFTALTSGEIASGEPVATTTQTKVKGNFDDHETRIEALESSVASFTPIIFRINGGYFSITDVIKTTANSTMNLIGCRILIDLAGTSGTTQIDIKKSRAGGAYTSIFSTLPSATSASGNDYLSTNGVLDPTKVDILAGDILRLDITSSQVAALGFLVRLDWNRG